MALTPLPFFRPQSMSSTLWNSFCLPSVASRYCFRQNSYPIYQKQTFKVRSTFIFRSHWMLEISFHSLLTLYGFTSAATRFITLVGIL